MLVLFLEPLQLLELFCAHSTVFLFPAIIRLFSNADLPDRIQARNALACQHLNLPQLNNNLFRLRSRNSHLRFSVFLTIGTDQFKGGGSGWINKGDNVGVLLHWHAVTNATEEALEDVLGDAYWLDGERLYKTSAPGVYVQSLHSTKSFDVNIGKMASYALKSATRYKHTFIGSDCGDELMLQSELSGLINLYHQIQKRNWRALLFTHTIGSREMTVLSNKEADSSD